MGHGTSTIINYNVLLTLYTFVFCVESLLLERRGRIIALILNLTPLDKWFVRLGGGNDGSVDTFAWLIPPAIELSQKSRYFSAVHNRCVRRDRVVSIA